MFTRSMIARLPLFAPEGEAGGASEGAAPEAAIPSPAAEGVAPEGQTTLTKTPPAPAEGDAEKSADDSATDGDDKGNPTDDQSAETFKLEAPEGFEDFADDFAAFEGVASDWLKANPDATAADALKWAAATQAEKVKGQIGAQGEALQQQIAQWATSAESDKEFGGDAFNENVAVAAKAVEAFGTPEFRSLLNESGLGSHPEVIRFAFRAGQQLRDAPVLSGDQTSKRKSLGQALYGNK